MCGILFTNREIKNLKKVIKYLKQRGPDATNHLQIKEYNFIHCLLSMTGKFTTQPFISDNGRVVTLFNGEIYNYKDFEQVELINDDDELVSKQNFKSDGECIIPAYNIHGTDFIKQLDGEFAIVLIDFSKNLLMFSSDIFCIKPIFYSLENNHIGISSYQSCLTELGFTDIQQCEPNTTYIYDLEDLKLTETKSVHDFDLRQHKTNFNDWNRAFQNAIYKRTHNIKHGIFIGLSSGYDSGAIACELKNQNVNFTPYSIVGTENEELISKRLQYLDNGELIKLDKNNFLKSRDYLKEFCEEYNFKIENGEKEKYLDIYDRCEKALEEFKSLENDDSKNARLQKKKLKQMIITFRKRLEQQIDSLHYRMIGQKVTDDNGSIGVSHICSLGKPQDKIIYLSGSGADEVFSDYGFNGIKHFTHSTIGGLFPDDLSTVFPWLNFYNNTQRAYLMKEETVTGAYGIEGRYPFLDKYVVQEFLWLDNKLKNQNYKAPLYQYMKKYDFPFEENIKTGFNCGFGNIKSDYEVKNSVNIVNQPVGTSEREDLKVNFDNIQRLKEIQKKYEINFDCLLKEYDNKLNNGQ